MILTRTPLRVSLFGGGTDHPEWFLRNGGAVLGMAIDKFVYAGVKRMPPGQIGTSGEPIRYRVQYSHVDDCLRAEDVQHPAIRAALRYLKAIGRDEPMEFHCFADLPGRSGLGGSSSFVVGLLNALQRHGTIRSDGPIDLAREAIAFEKHMVPEAVGMQDQIFAALGGINYVRFGAETQVRRIELPPERLKALERALVLVYSGAMRDAHAMAQKQIDRIPRNEEWLSSLAHMAAEGTRALSNEREPLAYIGHLLNSAWEAKRKLHPEISSPAIDALYAKGRILGALGGKLLGAGGGGFVLFYVPADLQGRFAREIGAPCIKFRVAHEGSRVIVGEL